MGSTAILEKSLEGVDLHVASQLIELIFGVYSHQSLFTYSTPSLLSMERLACLV